MAGQNGHTPVRLIASIPFGTVRSGRKMSSEHVIAEEIVRREGELKAHQQAVWDTQVKIATLREILDKIAAAGTQTELDGDQDDDQDVVDSDEEDEVEEDDVDEEEDELPARQPAGRAVGAVHHAAPRLGNGIQVSPPPRSAIGRAIEDYLRSRREGATGEQIGMALRGRFPLKRIHGTIYNLRKGERLVRDDRSVYHLRNGL